MGRLAMVDCQCAKRSAHVAALLLMACACSSVRAQSLQVQKVEPPNWWVGMRHDRIQLMLTGVGLADCTVESEHRALSISAVHPTPSGRYAFVDVHLGKELRPGEYVFVVRRGDRHVTFRFPLRARSRDTNRHQGFSAQDTIYLITPDRFANGDPSNDRVPGMVDEWDPTNVRMRHGGDLAGIQLHLDHLVALGVTAIWLNPVLENNGVNSYHGYKATDLYRVDPRFGGNEAYRDLVRAAQARGIKVIFDHVSNHIGIRHPWMNRLPMADWINGSKASHLSDKHYLLSLTDPHALPVHREELKTFWFVDKMPDLNQRNPFLANYLIQNSIWWVEFAGLDGIREDTYPYADQTFLTRWARALRDEFPRLNIVGEIWALHPAYIARFQEKTILPRDHETHLPAVMDFPLMEAYRRFLKGEGKLRDVYEVYAQDFLYTDPNNLLVFLDNHDTARAIYIADGAVQRVELALTLLLMGRGIPQLLYGTEINLRGGASHVELRADFPGGFPGDPRSAFDAAQRTPKERRMFSHIQKLLQIRKTHDAVTRGTMTHYPPTWRRDVYLFERRAGAERVITVANGHEDAQSVALPGGVRRVRNLLNREERAVNGPIDLPGLTAQVLLVVADEEVPGEQEGKD